MSDALEKLRKATSGGLVSSSSTLSSLKRSVGSTNLEKKLDAMTAGVIKTSSLKLKQIKEQTIEIINIFDKSGSCEGMERATIEGFNALINSEKRKDFKTYVTTSLFNGYEDLLYEGIDIKSVPPLSYRAMGGTALYDTLVTRLTSIIKRHKEMGENAPKKTIVTIMTDGKDEHSKLYTESDVRRVIAECRALGWEFIFLGANIEAKQVANFLGIPPENAENYDPSPKGVLVNFKALELAINSIREEGKIDPNWSEIIKRNNHLALGGQSNIPFLGGR